MVKQPKTKTITEYGSVALGTSDIPKDIVAIQPLADITGIDIDLSVTMTGTLTGPQPITKAIKRLSIQDRFGKPILDVAGSDLDKLYQILNLKGHYTSVPNASTSAQVWQALLNQPIKMSDQPARLQVTFAPYSDLATSGASGGTVNLKLRCWYGETGQTLRVYRKSVSLVTGDQSAGLNLSDDKNTIGLAIAVGTESNINTMTFSAYGEVDDYAKIPLQQLIDLEKQVFVSGHTTGLFNLFVTPFLAKQNSTRLDFNMAGADTVVIYQLALN